MIHIQICLTQIWCVEVHLGSDDFNQQGLYIFFHCRQVKGSNLSNSAVPGSESERFRRCSAKQQHLSGGLQEAVAQRGQTELCKGGDGVVFFFLFFAVYLQRNWRFDRTDYNTISCTRCGYCCIKKRSKSVGSWFTHGFYSTLRLSRAMAASAANSPFWAFVVDMLRVTQIHVAPAQEWRTVFWCFFCENVVQKLGADEVNSFPLQTSIILYLFKLKQNELLFKCKIVKASRSMKLLASLSRKQCGPSMTPWTYIRTMPKFEWSTSLCHATGHRVKWVMVLDISQDTP